MQNKRTVAIGFIGATLDRVGKGANRWSHWRPSVGLCQQPDVLINRLELIHGIDARDVSLAERVRADIQQVSPETEVRLHSMSLRNPWDFEEVYGALHDFTTAYAFDTGAQNARDGLLRAADGGMLFLDEIGELGADEQAMLLKAIEEKRFFPLGSDKEVESDFLIIAGTHRDLRSRVAEGLFREDLYARVNLWTFDLPGLAGRREDIEPNIDFELQRHAREHGQLVRFNLEARRLYLAFASSREAAWLGNFRELSASITRMATLADSGRIDEAQVQEEIERLRYAWGLSQAGNSPEDLPGDAQSMDLFDRLQLRAVLEVCRQADSLSDAGRRLFGISRLAKAQPNDADRLRKYLGRFGIEWSQLAP